MIALVRKPGAVQKKQDQNAESGIFFDNFCHVDHYFLLFHIFYADRPTII
jgi:hypothetical protein